MQISAPDFTLLLEKWLTEDITANFASRSIMPLIGITVALVLGFLLIVILRRPGVQSRRNVALPFALLLLAVIGFQYWKIRENRAAQVAALQAVPAHSREAARLVQRLIEDPNGAAVATNAGTYLAHGGDQVFLPKKVAAKLQTELVARNLRLP